MAHYTRTRDFQDNAEVVGGGVGPAVAAAVLDEYEQAHQDASDRLDGHDALLTTLTAAAAGTGVLGRPGHPQTGSFTLAVADAGAVVEVDSAATARVTVPRHTTTAFPAGFECDLVSLGAGDTLVVPEAWNVIANPSFTPGIIGWGARNSTVAHQPTGGVDSTGGLRCTATSASAYGAFGPVMTFAALGLAPGDVVSARMWLSPSTGQVRFAVRFQAGTATISETYSEFQTTAGVATNNGITIPVGADSMRFVIDATGGTGNTVDVDQVMLLPAATAPASYSDGSTAGGFWLGTANGSASMGPLLRAQTLTIPRYGRMRMRHSGSGVWTATLTGLPDEALRTTDTLVVDRDNGQAGVVAPPGGLASPVATALAANTLYLARFVPSRTMTPTLIGFRVTTVAASDAPVEVALFTAGLSRIATSGAVLGLLNSTGTKTAAIPATILDPGAVYYAGIVPSAAVTVSCASFPGDAFGSAAPQAEMLQLATSYPTPTTLVGVAATDAAPQLYVREA